MARTQVTLTVVEARTPAAEPHVPFSIVQAVLKGAAMDDVVRDATMVGASAIVPVVTSHVAVRSGSRSGAAAVERWRRIAVASAKQCRRAVVPDIQAPLPLAAWLASGTPEMRLMLVEPSAPVTAIPFRRLMERKPPGDAALVIGPEGGWDRMEIEQALAAGCVPVTLGSLTLRAHTVALAAGVLFRSVWDE